MKSICHLDINGTAIFKSFYDTEAEDKDYVINESILKTEYLTENFTLLDYIKEEHDDYSKIIKNYHKNEFKDNIKFQSLRKKVEDKYVNPTKLFNSFIKFIKTQKKFVIRTFGNDLVIKFEIQKVLNNSNCDYIYSYIKYIDNKPFLYVDCNLDFYEDIKKYADENKFVKNWIEMIEETNYIFLITDDYEYWNKNGRLKEYGKPIYGVNYKHYFFDDYNQINIINKDKAQTILVNTVEALLDDDYFINLFK